MEEVGKVAATPPDEQGFTARYPFLADWEGLSTLGICNALAELIEAQALMIRDLEKKVYGDSAINERDHRAHEDKLHEHGNRLDDIEQGLERLGPIIGHK